jgi:hypothetical protein
MRDGLERQELKVAAEVVRADQRVARSQLEGVAGWLLRIWQRSTATPARLAVIERIALGPKQSLVLVEAEGVQVLVATSPEGSPAFLRLHPVDRDSGQGLGGATLDERSLRAAVRSNAPLSIKGSMRANAGRVSW